MNLHDAKAILQDASGDYESLPESIKKLYTPKEYAWLGEYRDRMIDVECNPDGDVTE
jgi:hypothetical protein